MPSLDAPKKIPLDDLGAYCNFKNTVNARISARARIKFSKARGGANSKGGAYFVYQF